MSYRTYIENTQIFGNHECYRKWLDFLRTQGIEPDENDCYEGDITDVMGMLLTLEDIVCDIEKNRCDKMNELIEKNNDTKTYLEMKDILKRTYKSIFCLEDIYFTITNQDKNNKFGKSLLDELIELSESGYMFLPYSALKACEHKLEQCDTFSTNGHFHCYKLKPNEKIHIYAR